MSNSIRTSDSKLLLLRSNDRRSGSSCDAIFSINNQENLVGSLSVRSFSCPHLFGNVPDGASVQFQRVTAGTGEIDLSNPVISVAVPAGRYTSTELVAALNLAFDNTVTHADVDFTLATLNGLDYILWADGGGTDTLIIDNRVDRRFSLVEQLGISAADTTARGGAIAATASVKLNSPTQIQITSANMSRSGSMDGTGDTSHTLCVIHSANVPYGSMIEYTSQQMTHDTTVHQQKFPLNSELDIRLLDEYGRQLSFITNEIETARNHGWGLDIVIGVV